MLLSTITNWFKCHRAAPQILDSPGSQTPASPKVDPVVVDGPRGGWWVRCGQGMKKCCGLGRPGTGGGCPCGFKANKPVATAGEATTQEKGEQEPVEEIIDSKQPTATEIDDPFIDTSSTASPEISGGAPLTRTETIEPAATTRGGDATAATESDPIKTKTWLEKCKGLVNVKGDGK
ncbi:hypothetical protein JCM3766R1_000373 [Sporobolomyces carnicolor]